MIFIDRHHGVNIGSQAQNLGLAVAAAGQFDSQKGRIFDLDAAHFDRRDQPVITGLIAPEHG